MAVWFGLRDPEKALAKKVELEKVSKCAQHLTEREMKLTERSGVKKVSKVLLSLNDALRSFCWRCDLIKS